MGRGPTNLPLVHPAVPTFRRMNRRLGDIFAKKKRHIYLINEKKIKKINIDGLEDPGRSKRSMPELAVILEILHALKKGNFSLASFMIFFSFLHLKKCS